MSGTKFFIELPADEHGSTSMQSAVVEAQLTEKNGRDFLIPVAPEHHVNGWPTGWYRDIYGGWAEVEGPARMLTYEEHMELVSSLSEEAKADAKSEIVELRTGEILPKFLVQSIHYSLRTLLESYPIAFYEAVMVARNPQHQPFGNTGQVLFERRLIESDGRMHDLIRSVTLASTEGDLMDMKLISPYATAA